MLRQRSAGTVLTGVGVWLAVVLLAVGAGLLYTELVSAQESSTAPALTAAAGEGAVALSWEAVSGAERYELLVWTSADGWQRLDDGALTGTTYTHSGLAAGTTYYYAVRAVQARGVTGPWSEYASATVAAAQSLDATPTATATATVAVSAFSMPVLTAEAGEGEGTVALSWTTVSGAVRYELLVWAGADGWQDVGGDNLTGTTYSHTGLAAGTTHYYSVRAVNGSGETSEWSEAKSATVAATQASTATVSALSTPVLTAEAGEGEGTVALSWTTVTGAVRYELSVWTSADGWQDVGGDNLTGTSYTHSGLAAGTTHYYSVRAVNGSGDTSEWSEAKPAAVAATQSSIATPTPTATGATVTADGRAIGAVRLVSSQPGELEVSWDAPAETPRDYRISWARVGESFLTWTDLSGNAFPTSASYTITGLEEGVRYKVKVRARFYFSASGDWSEIVEADVTAAPTATATATATPSPTATVTATPTVTGTATATATATATVEALAAPTNFRASYADGAIVLTWDAPGGGSVSHYALSRHAALEGRDLPSVEVTVDGGLTTYTDSDVQIGVLYDYYLRAYRNGQSSSRMGVIIKPAESTATPVVDTADREVLAALYNATDGDNWAFNNNWLSDSSLGTWYGVTHDNGRVTGLYLNGNRLSGSIPAALGNLSNLTGLYLKDNELSGCIPDSLFTVADNDLDSLGLLSCGAVIVAEEREALVALYNATDGDNWYFRNNWLSNKPVGTWEGVTTDGNGRVTTLYLNNYQLSGTIPAELGNLGELALLDLSSNELSGSIPSELGNLSNLVLLYLNDNELSGSIPAALGNLGKLTGLYLSDNELSGSIPTELGNLGELTQLTLSDNELSGSIPSELGNLSNLTTLTLSSNELSGSIPAALGNLGKLTGLYLKDNELSGSIPTELGNLGELTQLTLSDNELSGPIPAALGNLGNLVLLYLNGNELSGSIPAALGNLTTLQGLRLNDNELSGPIPTALGNLSNLVLLYLNDNELSGSIPAALGNLSNLTGLYLKDNELSGCIPDSLFTVADNDLDSLGLLSCGAVIVAEEREALVALYNATDGDNWYFRNNWLSNKPVGTWEGVTTDGNGRVTTLYLGPNNYLVLL